MPHCATRKHSIKADKLIGVVRHRLSEKRRANRRGRTTAPSSAVGNIRCMKILNLIHVMVAQAFYNWAMREINPLHPDLPRIMLRQKELADKAQRVFA